MMTLSAIDWTIVAVYLAGCVAAGVWMKRYVRGVEDFAVAGREMDVNLGIASLAATELGIVTVMYTAQMGFTHGFAGALPGVVTAVAMFLVGATGFVIVPLRNAGVITIPELFEKRFGTRVRWLAGVVVILGGLLNMGIFLRLGGEFLVNMTGLDQGFLELTMTALLLLVLFYTAMGGMLSVLVTDYLQFLVMGLGIVITSVLVIWTVGWSDLKTGMMDAHRTGTENSKEVEPLLTSKQAEVEKTRNLLGDVAAEKLARQLAGELAAEGVPEKMAAQGVLIATNPKKPFKAITMGNPFDPISSKGWAWVVWQSIFALSVVTTWQTTIARVLSAKDAGTAKRMYRRTAFYWVGRFGLPGLWGAGAFVYFATHGGLPAGVDDMTAMPAFLKIILPTGIIGIMLAAMLAAEMSTDSGYLLTWATVIYNDIFSPLLRKPLSSKAKLLTVRVLVVLIGVFLLFYGLWYELPGSAWDYLAVTGNIYLASLFTLLVGALYWRPANSWGAMAAIVLGAIGPLSFVIVNAVVPPDSPWQIPAELAGFASFGMAFAGMLFGSLVARAMGQGFDGHGTDTNLPKETTV